NLESLSILIARLSGSKRANGCNIQNPRQPWVPPGICKPHLEICTALGLLRIITQPFQFRRDEFPGLSSPESAHQIQRRRLQKPERRAPARHEPSSTHPPLTANEQYKTCFDSSPWCP